nr:MAG TPA: hypothetical protein [Caudoviricetes sp.]
MEIRQGLAVFLYCCPRTAPSQPALRYYPKHSGWYRQH